MPRVHNAFDRMITEYVAEDGMRMAVYCEKRTDALCGQDAGY
jgi:hypothetical protein